ncbi:uncharacterized protein LOC128874672 [Hylaeus volcanicus]|uniref:uncharacterized protein LOC128874672 n=1 Tax=Hylaeus volcanicus TaxID=313075 RepID=UPI0023B8542B|nr:uncharacterized protein LOC128874672 [Hylaeus volcanicus]
MVTIQVVYNTGHTMAGYTTLWCMHGCYDKALVTIEKGLDCNPYNPGFTLLKAIVLRLSGRLGEANSWLEDVSKNFYKLAESSKDTQESIMGKLTIDKTRKELIKQWYLIRYDEAVECILNDKLETAARIIYSSKLTKYFTEAYILLGDSFFRRGNDDLALEMYLKCREKMRKLRLPASRNAIDVTERIIDILNDRAKIAVSKGHSKDAIILTKQVLRILDEDQVELNKLGPQRGCALLHKARGLFQMEIKSKERSKECCESVADSLRFLRELCDTGLYRSLYGNRCTEDTIDKFAPKRKLPRSLKILMQYS